MEHQSLFFVFHKEIIQNEIVQADRKTFKVKRIKSKKLLKFLF